MKNLNELIQKYKVNPCVETQQKIASYYIKSKNKEEIKEELKNFINEDNAKGGIDWTIFFEGDKKLWKDIYLMQEEKTAKKFLERTLSTKEKPAEILLDMSTDMCEISCSNTRDIKGLNKEIEKVWMTVFHEFPDFNKILTESREKMQAMLQKHFEKFNIPVQEEKETTVILRMTVPVIVKDTQGEIENVEKILNTKEYQEFMSEREEFVNNFKLQGYMDCPQCNDMTLEVKDGLNIFTLKLNSTVNVEELRGQILGQLSDGLGESLTQQPLIIEDNQYYFDFDIRNASDLLEIKDSKKLKMK